MALINCPDCGTEVSDQAKTCPKCMRPNPALLEEDIEINHSYLVLGIYWLGYILALFIFFVKNGFILTAIFGGVLLIILACFFIGGSILSWIYVIYAICDALFSK